MKRHQPLLQKIIITLAIVMMVGAPIFLVTIPKGAAYAIPTEELFTLPGVIKLLTDALFFALETAGYKTLKFFARNLANDMAVKTLGSITGGAPGQEPLFFDKQPGLWLLDMANEAGTGLIEGFTQGAGEALDEAQRDDKAQKAQKDVAGLDNTAEKKIYDEYQTLLKAAAPASADTDTKGKPVAFYAIDANKKAIDKVASITGAKTAADKEVTDFKASKTERFEKFRRGNEDGISKTGAQLNNFICNPDLSFRLKIAFGGFGSTGALPIRDRKSTCSLFELQRKDWNKVLTQTKVNGTSIDEGKRIIEQKDARAGWSVLQSMVDPNQSDLGLAFNFQNSLLEEIRDTTEKKLLDRQENTPIKSLATHSGQIQTPGSFLKSYTESALVKSSEKDSDPKYTGRIFADLADVAGTFLDTFLNKSQDLLFNPKKGLAAKTPDTSSISIGGSSLSSDTGPAKYITQETTRGRISELATVKLSNPESLNILAQLQSTECDKNPNACTITAQIAGAIQGRMTVKQAMEEGNSTAALDEKAVFGFEYNGGEPDYSKGLPYRSIVILRKYRVLPVSWELAALYIQKHQNTCGTNKSCTLKDVTDAFYKKDSPLYRLVDPAWVLKLPAIFCMAKGYGSVSELDPTKGKYECLDTNKDGYLCCEASCMNDEVTPGRIKTSWQTNNCLSDQNTENCKKLLDNYEQLDPRLQICLDEQTCLSDDQNGTCKDHRYGYCLEEKKTWNFPGSECKEQFVSCNAFTDRESGKTFLFLRNSIEDLKNSQTNLCRQNNAGCRSLSKELIPETGINPIVYKWSEVQDDQIYLAEAAKLCNGEAEGCRGVKFEEKSIIPMRLAPDYYGCQMNSATLKPYQKKECKKFALSCTSDYVGCESYQPEDGTSVIAGKVSSANVCNEKCVDYQQFSMTKTDFESVTSTSFIAQAPAKFCPAQEAGCDEFTNLDITSGEKREYFKRGQKCEKPTENTPSHAIFYSWYGSDTGGQKLEKYTLKFETTDTTKSTLACSTPTECSCGGPSDPGRSKAVCQKLGYREFINQSGTILPKYYRLDRLIIVADDCHPYRRTLSGPSADSLSISPSYSERWSS